MSRVGHEAVAWCYARVLISVALLAVASLILSGSPRVAAAQDAGSGVLSGALECAPGVDFLGFSDKLDKQTFEGTNVGGLSGLTYDASRDVYYGLVDNEGATAARFYTLRLPTGASGSTNPKFSTSRG